MDPKLLKNEWQPILSLWRNHQHNLLVEHVASLIINHFGCHAPWFLNVQTAYSESNQTNSNPEDPIAIVNPNELSEPKAPKPEGPELLTTPYSQLLIILDYLKGLVEGNSPSSLTLSLELQAWIAQFLVEGLETQPLEEDKNSMSQYFSFPREKVTESRTLINSTPSPNNKIFVQSASATTDTKEHKLYLGFTGEEASKATTLPTSIGDIFSPGSPDNESLLAHTTEIDIVGEEVDATIIPSLDNKKMLTSPEEHDIFIAKSSDAIQKNAPVLERRKDARAIASSTDDKNLDPTNESPAPVAEFVAYESNKDKSNSEQKKTDGKLCMAAEST
ncbi:hypothetical protein NP233_g11540 [Leucocoprinus birnbaumii]|uniref:Uncharacterized protein n=1 Tax=Leucocoprinus birnbaumii TaxID=56174 RepID=A0AAD5VJW2_9AGAR|nr:hypothetical protein NP233_g11540 [Leucocoprinus birnbaumii]